MTIPHYIYIMCHSYLCFFILTHAHVHEYVMFFLGSIEQFLNMLTIMVQNWLIKLICFLCCSENMLSLWDGFRRNKGR